LRKSGLIISNGMRSMMDGSGICCPSVAFSLGGSTKLICLRLGRAAGRHPLRLSAQDTLWPMTSDAGPISAVLLR
jgi:hypothetical protein